MSNEKQMGWVCPVCGRVYAPWVPECTWHRATPHELMSEAASDNNMKVIMDNLEIDWLHHDGKTKGNIK